MQDLVLQIELNQRSCLRSHEKLKHIGHDYRLTSTLLAAWPVRLSVDE
jgi:hypothetical protein